ncbi:hypothetical protein ACFQX6_24090 [Streptosporangium lutulentum]
MNGAGPLPDFRSGPSRAAGKMFELTGEFLVVIVVVIVVPATAIVVIVIVVVPPSIVVIVVVIIVPASTVVVIVVIVVVCTSSVVVIVVVIVVVPSFPAPVGVPGVTAGSLDESGARAAGSLRRGAATAA